MRADPSILESARRHGVADADMLHAYRNAIRIVDDEGAEMRIGPDRSARLLELIVSFRRATPAIIQAMPVREKYLRS